jgi:hypothetical protein
MDAEHNRAQGSSAKTFETCLFNLFQRLAIGLRQTEFDEHEPGNADAASVVARCPANPGVNCVR